MSDRWQGMNWIRQEKRLAIYLRDGCACVYCGASVENEGTILSLDHLVPRSRGGGNGERNLVTCCKRCNDSRSTRPWTTFMRAASRYRGLSEKGVELRLSFVKQTVGRKLPLDEAKMLVTRRGSCLAALSHVKGEPK